MKGSTIIHIPHSSLCIPEDLRIELEISDEELENQLLLMVDRYTDELFNFKRAIIYLNKVARIVFDPERFRNRDDEVMEYYGMGAVYEKTSDGKKLRSLSDERREELLNRFYDPYHKELTLKVASCLNEYRKCIIIDGHSFPSVALPFEQNKQKQRPDICIGTDGYHTPEKITQKISDFVLSRGYSINLNFPFAGSLVPMAYYGKDKRVVSVMIEVNRKLYMDETTGYKNEGFAETKSFINDLLTLITDIT